jgi:hypothetical protein
VIDGRDEPSWRRETPDSKNLEAAGSLGQKAEQRREESMALTSVEKKTAAEIVAMLDLQRHPDGGFYLETFRDPSISLPKSALPPRCKLLVLPPLQLQVFFPLVY